MKKIVFVCCVAALMVACKSTTNTPNAKTADHVAQTETTTTKPEEAAHNYSIVSGIGSHYTCGDNTYNEIVVELDGMPEYFSVSENVVSNADYIVVLDHEKIITFKEV